MLKKLSVYFLIFVFVAISLAGCGSSTNKSINSSAEYDNAGQQQGVQNEPTEANSKDLANTLDNAVNSGHKIIQTGEISLETLKFDDSINKIVDYVIAKGGFIESSSIDGSGIANRPGSIDGVESSDGTQNPDGSINTLRTANYVIRIPQSRFSKVFADFKAFGNIISQKSNGEDISDQYFDTQAHLKTLKIQEERLLALLQKANKMSDILAIEKQLQNIRYKIETYTGTIKKWDSLVSFSTVTITVEEVEQIQTVSPGVNDGLLNRIGYGFTNSLKQVGSSLQTLLVWFVIALPWLLIACILLLVVLVVRRKKMKKITDNKEI
ncbi:MAG: DUF4349 domain-containing protein [Clostridia bacterium]